MTLTEDQQIDLLNLLGYSSITNDWINKQDTDVVGLVSKDFPQAHYDRITGRLARVHLVEDSVDEYLSSAGVVALDDIKFNYRVQIQAYLAQLKQTARELANLVGLVVQAESRYYTVPVQLSFGG